MSTQAAYFPTQANSDHCSGSVCIIYLVLYKYEITTNTRFNSCIVLYYGNKMGSSFFNIKNSRAATKWRAESGCRPEQRSGHVHQAEAGALEDQFGGGAARGEEAEHPGLQLLEPGGGLGAGLQEAVVVVPRPPLRVADDLELLLQLQDLLALALAAVPRRDLQPWGRVREDQTFTR